MDALSTTKLVSLYRVDGSHPKRDLQIRRQVAIGVRNRRQGNMVELKVTGMTCNGCVNSVKRAINRVYPGASVEVELSTGLVRIDGEVELQRAEELITKAGYGIASLGA